MSIATIVTEGFGSFGNINYVVTEGFGSFGGGANVEIASFDFDIAIPSVTFQIAVPGKAASMATTIKATRGDVVEFTAANFKDADGNTFTPSAVKVYVDYLDETGNRVDLDSPINLTDTDGTWSATWDSSISYPGKVYVSMLAEGPPNAARDRVIILEANRANPDPA